MEINKIKTLLGELKELDPHTYNEIAKYGLNWNHPEEEFLTNAIIQSTTQDAILRHKWHYDISSWNLCDDKPEYVVEINEVAPGYDGDHYNEKHLYLIASESSNSLLEALLTSYIKTIKRNIELDITSIRKVTHKIVDPYWI